MLVGKKRPSEGHGTTEDTSSAAASHTRQRIPATPDTNFRTDKHCSSTYRLVARAEGVLQVLDAADNDDAKTVVIFRGV